MTFRVAIKYFSAFKIKSLRQELLNFTQFWCLENSLMFRSVLCYLVWAQYFKVDILLKRMSKISA